MKMLCDCGEELEVPVDFFDGGAAAFFRTHGHYPRIVMLKCACGESRVTGPGTAPSIRRIVIHAENDATQINTWYQVHKSHTEGAQGGMAERV